MLFITAPTSGAPVADDEALTSFFALPPTLRCVGNSFVFPYPRNPLLWEANLARQRAERASTRGTGMEIR